MGRIATFVAVAVCSILVGCASETVVRPVAPSQLFADALFQRPSVAIDADAVFAMSDEMKRYSHDYISHRIRIAGRREALLDAIYSKAQLRLEYDSEMTRNASEAFAARAGNCLSLAIMTGAFAKAIDVPVHYQIAAESLAARRIDYAYWWSRAAIAQEPTLASAYNTLGVVYQRHGDLAQAEAALRYALAQHPSGVNAMSNLVLVLDAQGRFAEAGALSRRLDELEPNPPFAYFRRGVVAMQRRDYADAKRLFAQEVDRAPYYDELRFWLAAAYVGLGDMADAREQLTLAIEYSTNRKSRDIYAAKLAKINAARATQ